MVIWLDKHCYESENTNNLNSIVPAPVIQARRALGSNRNWLDEIKQILEGYNKTLTLLVAPSRNA